MPFYRCDLAANLSAESATARIKAVVGPEPSFRQLFRRRLGRDSAATPPFIGTVEGGGFRFRRDMWYRNDSAQLSQAASRATFLRTPGGAQPALLSPVAMLVFGLVFVGVGFFPEALKARRLLEQALATPTTAS